MRLAIMTICFLLSCPVTQGQNADTKWYSQNEYNGILIQNSYPKGGPYPGPTDVHFNYSYLVFYSRVSNETQHPIEVSVSFSADSIAIPNSPDTFVKVFLPTDKMTYDKQYLFSYGITQLESFYKPTNFQRTIGPGEDCLFYTVAVFYQTKKTAFNSERGGNRAEFVYNGEGLVFNMLPQINSLSCGYIDFDK
jgi:hypothetical protein